jgi:hypothetical protein
VVKCPFCAEDDLKDEATVCKHCGRDLGAYPSLAAKIALLEQRVSELSDIRERQRFDAYDDPSKLSPRQPSLWTTGVRLSTGAALAGVGLGYGVVPLSYTLLNLFWAGRPGPNPMVLLSAIASVPPSVMGLWTGLIYPELPRRLYFSIGATYGVLFLTSAGLQEAWWDSPAGTRPLDRFVLLTTDASALVGFVLAPILALVAGGLLARAIWGTGIGSGIAQRLARRIVVARHAPGAGLGEEQQVKRLAAFLSAIAPLLTFAAALGSAYLGFLAKK